MYFNHRYDILLAVIILTKIYIVRHCEAIGNVQKLFQGVSDFDITEFGAEQLKFLENRFEDTQLDAVYSSPLIRTQKTAKAVVGKKNLSVKTEKGLIEINGGVIEGKPFLDSCKKYPDLADAWANHPQDFAPIDGDTMQGVYERIWNTIKNIAEQNKEKTVACVAHGGVIRCLMCKILHNDINQLKSVTIGGNTAVSLIEFDDTLEPTVKFMNDVSHLPDYVLKKVTPVITSVER